jgi:hypothetical protein
MVKLRGDDQAFDFYRFARVGETSWLPADFGNFHCAVKEPDYVIEIWIAWR